MDAQQEALALLTLLKRDERFTQETYRFINEVMDFAAAAAQRGSKLFRRLEDDDASVPFDPDNLSAYQFCRVAVLYASARYGYLARTVLEQLGIKTTSDLGDVMYNMIDVGLFSPSPDDSRDDFDGLFDLGAELDAAFSFRYRGKKRR